MPEQLAANFTPGGKVIREAVANGREVAETRFEAEAEAEELQSELEQAQNRIGELENQQRAVNTCNEEYQELVDTSSARRPFKSAEPNVHVNARQ